MSKKTHIQQHKCDACFSRAFCISAGKIDPKLQLALEKNKQCKTIQNHEILFSQKEVFRNLYIVKQGSFKKYRLSENGQEQVHAFFLPGELIGLDAISVRYYPFSVVALENNSLVCELPAENLLPFLQKNADTYNKFVEITSSQFSYLDSIPRTAQAKEKFAAFLINLAARCHHHALQDNETIDLPMSRQDVGNYLGLSFETISRMLTHFKTEGILNTHGKKLIVLNAKKLQKIAGF